MSTKKQSQIRVMANYRRVFKDPYSDKYWTALTCSVLAPSFEHPYASIHVSIANAGSKTLFRIRDIKALRSIFKIPKSHIRRLEDAFINAEYEANRIEADMKLLFEKRHLTGKAKLINTGTGEILAEAEDIVRKRRK